jgi:hypothetical protein
MVTVSTITSATPGWADPDGYRVVFDATSLFIGTQAVMSRVIDPGLHTFELTGLASNCQVTNGPNPRETTIEAGDTLRVDFQVDCQTPTGGVNVAIDFQSPGTFADTLVAQLDLGPAIAFVGSDTARFMPLLAGPHSIVVRGGKTNCLPAGVVFTRQVAVGDQPVTVAFPVSCFVPGPGSGSIQVYIQTSVINWPNYHPTYRVALDDTLSLTAPDNGSVTFENVPTGSHVIQVNSPPGCGTWFFDVNRKSVTVQADLTATVSFHEFCIG